MLISCQIGLYEIKNKRLKNFDILIYRHFNGYPNGEHRVINDILPFLKWWKEERDLDDVRCAGVRLLQYLCNKYDDKYIKNEEKTFVGTVGYEICKIFYFDIEFFYRIYPNTLKVYKTNFLGDKKKFKLIKTIEI